MQSNLNKKIEYAMSWLQGFNRRELALLSMVILAPCLLWLLSIPKFIEQREIESRKARFASSSAVFKFKKLELNKGTFLLSVAEGQITIPAAEKKLIQKWGDTLVTVMSGFDSDIRIVMPESYEVTDDDRNPVDFNSNSIAKNGVLNIHPVEGDTLVIENAIYNPVHPAARDVRLNLFSYGLMAFITSFMAALFLALYFQSIHKRERDPAYLALFVAMICWTLQIIVRMSVRETQTIFLLKEYPIQEALLYSLSICNSIAFIIQLRYIQYETGTITKGILKRVREIDISKLIVIGLFFILLTLVSSVFEDFKISEVEITIVGLTDGISSIATFLLIYFGVSLAFSQRGLAILNVLIALTFFLSIISEMEKFAPELTNTFIEKAIRAFSLDVDKVFYDDLLHKILNYILKLNLIIIFFALSVSHRIFLNLSLEEEKLEVEKSVERLKMETQDLEKKVAELEQDREELKKKQSQLEKEIELLIRPKSPIQQYLDEIESFYSENADDIEGRLERINAFVHDYTDSGKAIRETFYGYLGEKLLGFGEKEQFLGLFNREEHSVKINQFTKDISNKKLTHLVIVVLAWAVTRQGEYYDTNLDKEVFAGLISNKWNDFSQQQMNFELQDWKDFKELLEALFEMFTKLFFVKDRNLERSNLSWSPLDSDNGATPIDIKRGYLKIALDFDGSVLVQRVLDVVENGDSTRAVRHFKNRFSMPVRNARRTVPPGQFGLISADEKTLLEFKIHA